MKAQAFNPYLPPWEFIPDGEPHVFGGRVYVYGSHDLFNGCAFCLGDYMGWSAPVDDLSAWRCEGVIYPRLADPANAAGRMVLGALKDSYSYRLEGESRVSGDSAEQDVYLRSLDLRAVEAALQESARAHLEQIASQRSYYELCDENGFYLPSVVQEACDAAIGDLLGRMPEFYADHELTLQLVYSGGWYVRGTDELVAAIQGTASCNIRPLIS